MSTQTEVRKHAYVFPGQGSQSVGMGLELYEWSEAARHVFLEADRALELQWPLSELMFQGPEEDLRDTTNSQAAILVVSIACWKAWLEYMEICGIAIPQIVCVAGHSLGVYTAMVVAGVLKFQDAVRLARARGVLMQKASEQNSGGMAAIIGLDQLILEEICAQTGGEIANVNSDEQIVISGERIAVAQAMDLASARGARKTIPLPVSGAFHSRLMKSAQWGLAKAVAQLSFKDPCVPIIANSSGLPLTTATQIEKELIRGVCECVYWRDSVLCMTETFKVSHFIEFGLSRVLTSLIKRIDPSVQVVTLSDPDSIRKFALPS